MNPVLESATAFAPATVSNVACGFDVLGFALEAPGDEVTARFAPSGLSIDDIIGDDGRLPRDAARNTAGLPPHTPPPPRRRRPRRAPTRRPGPPPLARRRRRAHAR